MGKWRMNRRAVRVLTRTRFNLLACALCAVTAFSGEFSKADSVANQFGPGSNYTPPNGLISLPGVNAPCLGSANMALSTGLGQLINTLTGKNKNSSSLLQKAGVGTDGCTLGGNIPSIDNYNSCSAFKSVLHRKSSKEDEDPSIELTSSKQADVVVDPLQAMLDGLKSCDNSVASLQSQVQNCLQPAETQMNSQIQAFSSAFASALSQAKSLVSTAMLKEKDVQNQI